MYIYHYCVSLLTEYRIPACVKRDIRFHWHPDLSEQIYSRSIALHHQCIIPICDRFRVADGAPCHDPIFNFRDLLEVRIMYNMIQG